MRRTQVEPQPVAEALTRDLRFDRWLLDINRREDHGKAMAIFGLAAVLWLATFLDMPHGPPKADTAMVSAIGRTQKLPPTKQIMPIGGAYRPISTVVTTRTPNHTGSNPSFMMTG